MNTVDGKACFKCGIFKPIGEFYVHMRMADGHLNKCKECARKDGKERYDSRPELVAAYERRRGGTPHRLAKYREYNRTKRARHPEKYRAHYAVSNAIRDGRMTKQPCEFCGSTIRVEGHHDDYSRPLDLRWLCFKHHREIAHGQRTYGHLFAPPF
jgi:hypothetical protein